MNHLKTIVLLGMVAFLGSCEKVIDTNLKDAAPQLVIEAIVTNQAGPYEVKISKSIAFTDSNYFNGVTDAVVVIADKTGAIDTLVMTAPGEYFTTSLVGTPGNTYTLTVVQGGTTYTAVSQMPQVVTMDSLYTAEDPMSDNGYALVPVYNDPANITNYYKFKGYEGSTPLDKIRVRDDELTNGNLVQLPVRFGDKLNIGDTARLEFMCIDKNVYQYFYSLDKNGSSGGGGQSASPANPISNISGGCLGYFSANTLQSKTIVVQ